MSFFTTTWTFYCATERSTCVLCTELEPSLTGTKCYRTKTSGSGEAVISACAAGQVQNIRIAHPNDPTCCSSSAARLLSEPQAGDRTMRAPWFCKGARQGPLPNWCESRWVHGQGGLIMDAGLFMDLGDVHFSHPFLA